MREKETAERRDIDGRKKPPPESEKPAARRLRGPGKERP